MADDDETKVSVTEIETETENNHDIFLEHIHRFPDWKCPVCGTNKFFYEKSANPIVLSTESLAKMDANLIMVAPSYWVYCLRCFNISFFSKVQVDHFYKINNKEQTEDDKKK